jgi:uncharacterized cupin superfamily protein
VPLIDPKLAPQKIGTSYPAEYNQDCAERHVAQLGDAGGLTQFGANLVTLPPGCWASQRHAHSAEDEFCYILTGHPLLIDDEGEHPLSPGSVMTHKAGDGNAHHLINKTGQDVTFLVIGSRKPEQDSVSYPDINLKITANGKPARNFTRNDGKAI